MTEASDSEKDCTTFDKLFQPIKARLEQHERDHPPHHREKLHLKDLCGCWSSTLPRTGNRGDNC